MSFLELKIEQTARDHFMGEIEVGGEVCKRKMLITKTGLDLVIGIGAAMYELAPNLHADCKPFFDQLQKKLSAQAKPKIEAAPPVPTKVTTVRRKTRGRGDDVTMVR